MKDWYLTSASPNITSGYESDAISQYSQSNFTDVLLTDFSDTVILYNHNLSESQEIKAVIQGNTADTQLKTMERTILCPIGTLKAGMYIFYEDNYWLVTGRPDNNKSYEKSTLYMCNWLLKWQNKKGEIISRWSVVQSASKYNDGTDSNKVIMLGTDQLSLQIPLDEEAIKMPRGVKFFIDYNSDDPTVYELTNPSNVLYRYGEDNGITNWIIKETAYSPTADDLKYGVCDYKAINTPTPPSTDDKNVNKTTVLIAKIIYSGSDTIRIGGNSKKFEATLCDEDGLEQTMTAIWAITPTFDGVKTVIDGNMIAISCEDFDLDGEVITLSVTDNHSGFSTSVNITLIA